MAISVVNDWALTATAATSVEAIITPTAGNWLVCLINAQTVSDPTTPLFCVGDSARNMWSLVYSRTTQANAANAGAGLYSQVWVCPNVAYTGWTSLLVYVSSINVSAFDTLSPVAEIIEVAGMGNGFLTVDSVVTNTGTGTSFSLTVPAPAADCLMVATAGMNTNAIPATTSWHATTGGTNTNPNVGARSTWIEATTTQTATFTSTASQSWVGTAVALRQTGTVVAQPNANVPALDFQLGLGYTIQTPLTAVTWTSLPDRLYTESSTHTSTVRGIQYELGLVQSQPTTLTLRNDDGALTPRAPGSATATGNGTTTTMLVSAASGASITVGDFFQLHTSGGALKELTVFQVTGLSTAGGTTTVTFSRADGTGSGALAGTATGDVYAGTPIDVYNPYRIVATWNGRQYPVAAGWIERWPQTWNDPHWGYIDAVAIDSIATLTAADQTVLRGEILARNPQSYWPCSDQSGASTAQNASYSGTATLNQTTSSHGGGASGRAGFGANTQNVTTGFTSDPTVGSIVGDPGTGWSSSGLTSAEIGAGDGFALVANDASFPAISGGITIVCTLFVDAASWAVIQGVTSPTTLTMFVLRQTAGANTVFKVSMLTGATNGGDLSITWWNQSSGVSTEVDFTAFGAPVVNFFVIALTLTQTTYALYASSSGSGVTQVGTGTINVKPTFGHICIGGETDATTNGFCLPGLYSHAAIFPRVLSTGELNSIANAMTIGNYQNPVGSNDDISHKLWYVGWKGARALQYTNIYAGSDVPASTTAEKITNLSDQEGGRLFSDAGGQLQTRTRFRATYQTTKATLGDRPDLGEIPFVGDPSDLVIDYDPTYLYNQVSVVNSGASRSWQPSTATTYSVRNASSISKYGLRTLGKSVALANGSDASALASYLLTQYQTPKFRAQSVLIDLAGYPAALAFALGVEVGDLLTMNRRPIGAPAISLNVIVLQVQHDIGQDLWQTKLTLGVAPQ